MLKSLFSDFETLIEAEGDSLAFSILSFFAAISYSRLDIKISIFFVLEIFKAELRESGKFKKTLSFRFLISEIFLWLLFQN